MSYEIYDHWISLKFVKNGLECLVPKSAIKGIAVIGDDIIHISTGNCLGEISFNVQDVISPASISANSLADLLNFWVTLTMLPPGGSY